jgi:hypothetical protein
VIRRGGRLFHYTGTPNRLIGVIVFWVTQLVLIVDFELLWCFGLLIHFSYGRLVFSFVLVITVIIVFGTCSRRGRNAFGLIIAHKISSVRGIGKATSNVDAWT